MQKLAIIKIRLIFLLLLSVCFLSVSFLSGCSAGSSSANLVTQGQRMPATRITMLDGTYVSLENFLGKPLVVLFWARWCPHCRTFIPRLNEYASQVDQGKVNFLAISIDDNADYDKVKEFIDISGLTSLEHAFSGNGIYDEAFLSYGIEEFPKVVVHDSEGKITMVTNSMSDVKTAVRKLY